jgi:sodium/proline symporter
MAIGSLKQIPVARRIGMTWMIVALFGAAMTGLFGLAYMSETPASLDDSETIFIVLSQLLFHPLVGGFLLAAILAAIMSTISSQLLVTSSSLTRDIYVSFLHKDASEKVQVLVGRISVLVVAIAAIMLAFGENKTILSLVSHAWAGFGAAFGPLVLFTLFWRGMTQKAAIGGILSGAITVLIWIYAPLSYDPDSIFNTLYAIIPGFLVSTAVIYILGSSFPPKSERISKLFDEYQIQLKNKNFGNE